MCMRMHETAPRDLTEEHLHIFRVDYEIHESYIYYQDPKKILTSVENPKGLPLSCMVTYIGEHPFVHFWFDVCLRMYMTLWAGTRDDTTVEEAHYKGMMYVWVCMYVCMYEWAHVDAPNLVNANLLLPGWHDLSTYLYPDWGSPPTSQPYGPCLRLEQGRNFYYHVAVIRLHRYVFIHMHTNIYTYIIHTFTCLFARRIMKNGCWNY